MLQLENPGAGAGLGTKWAITLFRNPNIENQPPHAAPRAASPSACFDEPFGIYNETFMTWIRMEREFKQLTKNMWGLRFLVTLYCIWTLDYGAGYWSTVNVKYGRRANCNNCNLRDEPQQVYFLISRDIYFIQWKVTTQLNSTQQLGVCCLLGTSQQTTDGRRWRGFFDSFFKYDVMLSLFFVCIKLNTHLICSIHHDIEGHKKYQSNIKHKTIK